MALKSRSNLARAAVLLLTSIGSNSSIPADEWAQSYRNWTYYPDWIIPPSCIDTSTCAAPYIFNSTPPNLNATGVIADCFQLVSTSNPLQPNWTSPRYLGIYTFYDGVGYQTAYATSDDMLHFDIPLSNESGIIYSPRSTYNVGAGTFDYGAHLRCFALSSKSAGRRLPVAGTRGGGFSCQSAEQTRSGA